MAVTGVNFRQTPNHATDDTGFSVCAYDASTGATLTYSASQGYGWNTNVGTRDRPYSGYDNNFAGIHFTSTNGDYFRFDLPNGAGTYKVWAVHVDLGSTNPTGFRYKDGSTVIATISGDVTNQSGQRTYRNILNVVKDAEDDYDQDNEHWIAHTFTSDHLIIERDTSLQTGNGVIASVWVEPYTPPTGLGDEKLWLCPSLDDSAGDISGNGNHGTYNGGMGTVADTSNGGTRAYSFDGSNDYIQIYDSGLNGSGGWANFIAQGTFSVAMWYQVDPYIGGATGAPFWGTRSRGGYYGFSGSAAPISNNNTWNYRFSSTDNFNFYYDASSSSTSDTNWHHICWSVTSNTSQLFIDATLDSSLTPSTSPSQSVQTSLYFGRLKNWIYLNGRLDDIRIFDRALTTSEITALASKRGYEVPAASATTYHPFAALNHPLAQ